MRCFCRAQGPSTALSTLSATAIDKSDDSSNATSPVSALNRTCSANGIIRAVDSTRRPPAAAGSAAAVASSSISPAPDACPCAERRRHGVLVDCLHGVDHAGVRGQIGPTWRTGRGGDRKARFEQTAGAARRAEPVRRAVSEQDEVRRRAGRGHLADPGGVAGLPRTPRGGTPRARRTAPCGLRLARQVRSRRRCRPRGGDGLRDRRRLDRRPWPLQPAPRPSGRPGAVAPSAPARARSGRGARYRTQGAAPTAPPRAMPQPHALQFIEGPFTA